MWRLRGTFLRWYATACVTAHKQFNAATYDHPLDPRPKSPPTIWDQLIETPYTLGTSAH